MNPYLALLKQGKGSHTQPPKLTEAAFDGFGSTPGSRISKAAHVMQYAHDQEKQPLTLLTKPTKVPFGSFDSDPSGHITDNKQQGAAPNDQACTSACMSSKGAFVSFGSGAGSPFPEKDAMSSPDGMPMETECHAEAQGRFEGRCDILVWNSAISRQEADALVRLYGKNRDVAETKLLHLEQRHGLSRCMRCVHARRPGDTLHCGSQDRSDLEKAYGLLHFIPRDGGATCPFWIKTDD